jgi:HipA-like protein
MPFNFQKIEAVQVVLESKSSNQFVGLLKANQQGFYFEYDKKYLKARQAISLGPEMPLSRRSYQAQELFRPFADRIPSRENPAFLEYCKAAGISEKEDDPLVLLLAIAFRGPSSFIFRAIYNEQFTGTELKLFRENLGLTVREFALCFDFSQPGITRVETGKSDGREILKRAEIYKCYPNIALEQLKRRSGCLHSKKLERARNWLTNNQSNNEEAYLR